MTTDFTITNQTQSFNDYLHFCEPIPIRSGTYLIRALNKENNPIYYQFPSFQFKKKISNETNIDFEYQLQENQEFFEWVNKLYLLSTETIEKQPNWFQTPLTKEQIEMLFQHPIKKNSKFKNKKSITTQMNYDLLKKSFLFFNEKNNPIDLTTLNKFIQENIEAKNTLYNYTAIVQFQGICFTSKIFYLQFEIKKIWVAPVPQQTITENKPSTNDNLLTPTNDEVDLSTSQNKIETSTSTKDELSKNNNLQTLTNDDLFTDDILQTLTNDELNQEPLQNNDKIQTSTNNETKSTNNETKTTNNETKSTNNETKSTNNETKSTNNETKNETKEETKEEPKPTKEETKNETQEDEEEQNELTIKQLKLLEKENKKSNIEDESQNELEEMEFDFDAISLTPQKKIRSRNEIYFLMYQSCFQKSAEERDKSIVEYLRVRGVQNPELLESNHFKNEEKNVVDYIVDNQK
jgi:hypothetical protein